MKLLLLLLLVVACKKPKQPPQPEGGACVYSTDCETKICRNKKCQVGRVGDSCGDTIDCLQGNQCFENKCRPEGKVGDKCIFEAHCEASLICYREVCTNDAGKKTIDEAIASDERKQFQDKLKQAGVYVPRVAEKPETPVTPEVPRDASPTIRTVTSKGNKLASAACDKTERLTGGGCKADPVLSSYPGDQTATDTIGAKWNCTASSEVTAYALCAKF